MMKKYTLEIYFFKEDSKYYGSGMDLYPRFDEYKKETAILTVSTWESFRNEALRIHRNLAYIHVLAIENIFLISEDDDYSNEYETNTLYVGKSEVNGDGVFSKIVIEPGEKIISLDGEIVKMPDGGPSYPSGEWNAIAEGFYLCRKKRTIYGFINHSRVPNCAIDFSDFSVKTIKKIEPNEELFLDYRRESLPPEYIMGYGSTYL